MLNSTLFNAEYKKIEMLSICFLNLLLILRVFNIC